uniref:Uncharacterized protein n=1 Tax=Desertifilum tharense IPPAS B-1220 TaxID=1781255 RepID=A0ACD5H061_9CYAN
MLETDNWEGYLQQGRVFENKIVLIGPTAPFLKTNIARHFLKPPYTLHP